jgi:hypothetical protein
LANRGWISRSACPLSLLRAPDLLAQVARSAAERRALDLVNRPEFAGTVVPA